MWHVNAELLCNLKEHRLFILLINDEFLTFCFLFEWKQWYHILSIDCEKQCCWALSHKDKWDDRLGAWRTADTLLPSRNDACFDQSRDIMGVQAMSSTIIWKPPQNSWLHFGLAAAFLTMWWWKTLLAPLQNSQLMGVKLCDICCCTYAEDKYDELGLQH